ncbi:hypothetical protein [Streptomyces sp. NBC_00631]|uniref:2-oxoglutarate dehydrogenase E1 subunit family protein n=1 Tax=Streptomyces sp. NBC_00631 TaxID=2975793 RepID=UPI00386ABFD9
MASQSRAGQPLSNELDFGLNEWVVDEQHERYLQNPGSVDRAWRGLFAAPGASADRQVRGGTSTVSEVAVKSEQSGGSVPG